MRTVLCQLLEKIRIAYKWQCLSAPLDQLCDFFKYMLNSTPFKELLETFDHRPLPSPNPVPYYDAFPLLLTTRQLGRGVTTQVHKLDPVILYVKELGCGSNLCTLVNTPPIPSCDPVLANNKEILKFFFSDHLFHKGKNPEAKQTIHFLTCCAFSSRTPPFSIYPILTAFFNCLLPLIFTDNSLCLHRHKRASWKGVTHTSQCLSTMPGLFGDTSPISQQSPRQVTQGELKQLK